MTGGERRGLTLQRRAMKLLRELLFPLLAVAAAFLVGARRGAARSATTRSSTYELLIGSALSWPDGIGYTLFYATPLIFTGLAVAVAFRCGLLNIGAEGQLYVAAFATAWVGITFAQPAGVAADAAVLPRRDRAGAVWGGDPGRAQGAVRRARGHHHDHDELHRRRPGELLHAVPLQAGRRSDPGDGADRRERPHRPLRRRFPNASR